LGHLKQHISVNHLDADVDVGCEECLWFQQLSPDFKCKGMIDDAIMWWGKCVNRQGMYFEKLIAI
jgi:hypothetical protein